MQVVINTDEIPHVMAPLTRYDLFQGILERSLANIDPKKSNKQWIERKIVDQISCLHKDKLKKAQKDIRDFELDQIRKIELEVKKISKANQPKNKGGNRLTRQKAKIIEEEPELPETESEASLSTSDEDWTTAKKTSKKCYRVVVNQSDSPPSDELEQINRSVNNNNDESDEVGRERWALRTTRKIHTSSDYSDSSKENKSEQKEELIPTSSKTQPKSNEENEEIKKQPKTQSKRSPIKNKKTKVSLKSKASDNGVETSIFEHPSEWVTAMEPNRSPYLPQLNDTVYYFVQGHMDYVDSDLCSEYGRKYIPWKGREFKDAVKCKVVSLNFLTGPPTVCQITLVPLRIGNNYNLKDSFRFFYHDAASIPDFMVLQRHYEDSIRLNWKKGDAFRCLIDNQWWRGVVLRNSAIDKERFPNSSWRQIVVKWDNEEGTERLSPWDIEPLPRDSRSHKAYSPTKKHAGTSADDVLQISFVSNRDQGPLDPYIMHYYHSSAVWVDETRDQFKERMSVALSDVMERFEARDFVYPVNINDNPDYYSIVAYPTDLTTIHNRLLNDHYRSKESFLWEIRQIEINARAYNEDASDIIKHASNLVARIFVFAQTVSFKRINDEVTSELISEKIKSCSGNKSKRKELSSNTKTFNCEWHKRANDILCQLFKHRDSHPFQNPIDLNLYPDYIKYCSDPIDFDTIADNLSSEKYQFEEEFFEDIDRVFANSLAYNTRTSSRIYQMTIRLKSFYHSLINKLGDKHQEKPPKNKQKERKSTYASASTNTKKSSTSEYSSSPSTKALGSRQISLRGRKIYTSSSDDTSNSADKKPNSSSDSDTKSSRPLTRNSKRKRSNVSLIQSSPEHLRKSARVRKTHNRKESSESSSSSESELPSVPVKKTYCRRSSSNFSKHKKNLQNNNNQSNASASSDTDTSQKSESTPQKKEVNRPTNRNIANNPKNKPISNGKTHRPSRKKRKVIYEEVSEESPSTVSETESESTSVVRKSKRTRRKRQLSDFVSYSD